MRHKLLITFVFIFAGSAQAQDENSKELVTYVELWGPGFRYSINMEYPFYSKNKITLNGRLGFGMLKKTDAHYNRQYYFVSVPVGVAGYYGNRNGHLELALTASYMQDNPYQNVLTRSLNLFPSIGYRYQRPSGGFFGSLMWTPWLTLKDNGTPFKTDTWVHLGIGVGYAFSLKE